MRFLLLKGSTRDDFMLNLRKVDHSEQSASPSRRNQANLNGGFLNLATFSREA